jgi:LacI family transcriptional regulator
MDTRRVLIVLSAASGWSRGILRGFMRAAHERGWTLLHYSPSANLDWLTREWQPVAAVVGPELSNESLRQLAGASVVSVTVDRSADQIASVCLDEEAIATLALRHLLGTGLRCVSTFRFDESAFAVAREQAFITHAKAAGAEVARGWGTADVPQAQREEDPPGLIAWLQGLPKPCGIFTCTDSWGRTVSRYARVAGLRVPEDLALIGADNDVLECELMAPPLSSVMIPWQEVGRSAAQLVQLALAGESIAGARRLLEPVSVIARRSTDVLAIDDVLVAKAVRWIRANSDRRLSVPMVARAVGGGRQRLERRFRRVLDRSVQEEIRRARVEAAKSLLHTTRAPLADVAKRSGFSTAALLSVAFRRELGVSPGLYRRRIRQLLDSAQED